MDGPLSCLYIFSKMKTGESSGSPKAKTKAKAPPVVAGKDVYFDGMSVCALCHSSTRTCSIASVKLDDLCVIGMTPCWLSLQWDQNVSQNFIIIKADIF